MQRRQHEIETKQHPHAEIQRRNKTQKPNQNQTLERQPIHSYIIITQTRSHNHQRYFIFSRIKTYTEIDK